MHRDDIRTPRKSLVLAVSMAMFLSGFAMAANFTVNSNADSPDAKPGDNACADAAGKCSLRAAVMEANKLGGTNKITLPAGTYTLEIAGANENAAATGDLDVTAGTLQVIGAGRDTTIIDGAGIDRVFDLLAGTTVQMEGLTIKGGKGNAADSSSYAQSDGGGGIRAWESALTLSKVALTDNSSATFGGAIAFNLNIFGRPAKRTLKATDIVVRNNRAEVSGGGISLGGGATLELSGSSFMNNSARANQRAQAVRYGGGGLHLGQGYRPLNGDFVETTATITDTTFEGNLASDMSSSGLISGNAWGGAILLEKSTITISSSTFKANKAEGSLGGGIYNESAVLTVRNSKFDGNVVFGNGGAIYGQGVPNTTIDSSTFVNNKSAGDVLSNGGALNLGAQPDMKITINNCTFEGNSASGSGGALNLGANVTMTGGVVRNNTAKSNGGGIVVLRNTSTTPARISNVLIENNTADVRGGGLENGGNMLLEGATIRGNKTIQGDGGGLSSYMNYATVVNNTVISGNTAARNGGGIFDRHQTFGANNDNPKTSSFDRVTVEGNTAGEDGGGVYNFVSIKFTNSAIIGNTAKVSGGAVLTYAFFTSNSERQLYPINLELQNVTVAANTAAEGGGIYQNGGVSKLVNVTIAGNNAMGPKGGGGIHTDTEFQPSDLNPHVITLINSILATNTSNNGPDCAGAVASGGNNIVGNSAGCTFSSSSADKVGSSNPIDPLLATLANMGGPTKVLALREGSPAINAGNATSCSPNDQRGAPRVGACDIGAFEFGANAPK